MLFTGVKGNKWYLLDNKFFKGPLTRLSTVHAINKINNKLLKIYCQVQCTIHPITDVL